MTHAIGIMQGRLVPMTDGRIQSFPRNGWETEFALAAEIGLDSIELTIEGASWDIHPVRDAAGRARLRSLSEAHGVSLAGLCCDVFMETPFTDPDPAVRERAAQMLEDLVRDAAEAGLPMIELPMLGGNALAGGNAPDRVGPILGHALQRAEDAGLDILLETDLGPAAQAGLMAQYDHPRLGINYDTGNSTYFGFDADTEIPAIQAYIRNVHIKDCTRADYSVPLGTGETPLEHMFTLLARHGYRGDFILQAARQDDDVGAARDYLGDTVVVLCDGQMTR